MRLASFLAAALLLAACTPQTGAGSAAPSTGVGIEVTVSHTAAGDALAGAGGMTLYTLSNDTSTSSTCNGQCAATWPPLIGDGSQVTSGDGVSGSFGTITRDDGEQAGHARRPAALLLRRRPRGRRFEGRRRRRRLVHRRRRRGVSQPAGKRRRVRDAAAVRDSVPSARLLRRGRAPTAPARRRLGPR